MIFTIRQPVTLICMVDQPDGSLWVTVIPTAVRLPISVAAPPQYPQHVFCGCSAEAMVAPKPPTPDEIAAADCWRWFSRLLAVWPRSAAQGVADQTLNPERN